MCHARPHRDSQPPSTLGGRLCMYCFESRMSPDSVMCVSNSVSWQGTETHCSRISRNCLVPLTEKEWFVRGSYLWEQNAEGNLQLKLSVKWLSCVRLCDPMDCSLPGFSIHGIFQARILEWVAIFFSTISSNPEKTLFFASGENNFFFNLLCDEFKDLIF